MNFTIFLTLTTLVLAQHNQREVELARNPRDLLYWNRMYNTLQPFSKKKLHDEKKVERRPPPTFMCKALQHLLKKARTDREQRKLRITMFNNGC